MENKKAWLTIASKEALDKTALRRWLKDHVHYSVRALDALEGKTAPQKPEPASMDVVLSGETREDVAADAQWIMGQLSDQLAEIRKRKGALTSQFLRAAQVPASRQMS